MSYSGRIASIDLYHRCIEFEPVDSSSIRKWGGGSGIASLRLYSEVGPETDAMAPDNTVWIIGGPLTGTIAPCSGRIEVLTKSPLTGILGLSNTGGHLGARLKQTGLSGLVLRNASEEPVYIHIRPDRIEIRDAAHLWGKDTWETAEQIGRDLNDPGLSRIKVMAIGPAGERLVRFACPINEFYHAAARGGSGAVLGSKKVKAIVVDAEARPLPASEAFQDAAARAARKIKENATCQNYVRFGSLGVSDACLEMGNLPGKNYQTGVLDRWRETRGTDRIKSHVTIPEGSCYHCAMPCFNRVEVSEGPYRGLRISSGTFVQVVLEFGAKCGIESLPAIWKCKELCHRLGMDYGSASGVIAFATELFQRGLLTLKDTDGITLSWGNEDSILKLLTQIAHREGVGDLLADGALRASKVLGEASWPYVMTIKGMEMISTDVRASHRAFSVGSITSPRGGDNVRGTHMKGEMIPSLSYLSPDRRSEWELFSKSFVSGLDMFPEMKSAIYGVPPHVDPMSYQGKALMVKWFEDLFSAINALGLCIFPADKLALGPTDYADLFSAFMGEKIEAQEFMEIGERIFDLQRLYLVREGMGRKDDAWPARFFEEGLPEGPFKGAMISKERIENVLDEYYRARGWDCATGHPTSQTLERLKINLG